MADEELVPLAPIVDQLGIDVALADGEQITDLLVIAKVVSAERGEAHPVVLTSPGTDAITRTGLFYAAQSCAKWDR